LIKECTSRGHYSHKSAVARIRMPPAIILMSWVKPGRILDGASIRRLNVVPVFIIKIECSANINNVNVKPIEDVVFRLGKLLHNIIYASPAGCEPSPFLKVIVGNGRNS